MDLVPVAPDVYLLPFPVGQAYIWRHEAGLTLIDTGVVGSEEAILSAVRRLGQRPQDVVQIVLTHSHADHIGAASVLSLDTEAEVLAHEMDAAVISGLRPETPANLTPQEQRYIESVSLSVQPAPPAQVSKTVKDGDVVTGGGIILHVPGHTAGSIAVHVSSLGVLFTGDVVASMNGTAILGPFNVDRDQAMASVSRLAGLDFDVACLGHGAPLLQDASSQVRALARGF